MTAGSRCLPATMTARSSTARTTSSWRPTARYSSPTRASAAWPITASSASPSSASAVFTGWSRAAARPRLLASDFDQPNGLCLSLDEKRLWINDTMRGHIRVFDVEAGRRALLRPRLGGGRGRGAGPARRHEDRRGGADLLHGARTRHPCVRPRCDTARHHPPPGRRRQFLLRRRQTCAPSSQPPPPPSTGFRCARQGRHCGSEAGRPGSHRRGKAAG